MLYGSKRKEDMKAEQELGRFLDDYFYKMLEDAHPSLHCERQHEKHIQMEGIDVGIKESDKSILCIDEKVSIYYRNIMLPTFAFEISSIQRESGERIPGWLINTDLKTTHYLLMWANVKCNKKTRRMKEIKDISKDDFTIVEAILINKNRILNFLEKQNFSIEKIIDQEKTILKKNTSGKISVNKEDFYFYYSTDIAEKPISIVIKRKKLLELSSRAYYIGHDGLAQFK